MSMIPVSDFSKIHTIISELVPNDDMFNVMRFCSLKSDNFKINGFRCVSADFKYFFKIASNYREKDSLKIYFDSSKDYKAFLYDIRYFIKNAAPHAMQTTVTDTGYSIRQYFAEEDKKLLVWEISDNGDLIDSTIKCYFYTKELYDKLDEEFFSYGAYNFLNGLECGPFYSKRVEGFNYPDNIQIAISKLPGDFSKLNKEDQDKYNKVIDNYLKDPTVTVDELNDDIKLVDLEIAYNRAKKNNDEASAAALLEEINQRKMVEIINDIDGNPINKE